MADSPRVTPRIMSGFMELLPEDQLAFNAMYDTIRKTYELFGFAPIETPAIELSEVLFAKGGGETEKQIYEITRGNTKMALHFDLTVPLARYVAQHEGDLTFPFRRYQMQKVWRAERAQRGRFREFYQCDIDVIGSYEPTTDAEIPSVIYAVFKALGFDRFTIRVNNRKVLNGFFEAIGAADKATDVLRTVDKIDKIGPQEVGALLEELGLSKTQASQVLQFVQLKGDSEEILAQLATIQPRSEMFDEGVKELAELYSLMGDLRVPRQNVAIDLSIARGLDYYTGTVYETVLDDYPQIGSVCSGGRYDDLAGYYTETDLPGVGISIGLTRLFYQLKEAGLVESRAKTPAQVLVLSMNDTGRSRALEVGSILREAGVPAQVFYERTRDTSEGAKPYGMKQMMRYANRIGVPFVAIIGDDELVNQTVTVKNLHSGTQQTIPAADIASVVTNP